MRPLADGDGADRIDHRKRGDGDAVLRHRRGGADTGFQRRSGCAKARADAALCEGAAGGTCGLIAKLEIGRDAAPFLVAAIDEIEHHRARHDRNQRIAHRKAAPVPGKPRLDAAAGFETEGRSARQRQRVDPLHGVGKIEQRAFADAGAAAAHVHRHHRRLIEHDRRDAGRQSGVIGMADAHAGNIGQTIFHESPPDGREPHSRLAVNARRHLSWAVFTSWRSDGYRSCVDVRGEGI